MRIDEALMQAPYARRPLSLSPDRLGRGTVDKWLVIDRNGYYGGNDEGITVCYPDMVPMLKVSYQEAARYMMGTEDWEPYPPRYVIDLRRRFMRIEPRWKNPMSK